MANIFEINRSSNILTLGNSNSSVVLKDLNGTIISTAGVLSSIGEATDGQLPIGSTDADPVLATLTAGAGVDITNGAGSITVASTITQYTDEKAQDAIGEMIADTNTIDLTYTDATPELKADVLYQNSTTIDLSDDASGLKADLDSTLKTNYDAAHAHISSDGTDHSYIDQDLRTTASPDFVSLDLTTTSYVTLLYGNINYTTEANQDGYLRVVNLGMNSRGGGNYTGYITGLIFPLRHYGTGTLNIQRGIWVAPQNLGTEDVYGNITTQEGILIASKADGGTIGTYYGIEHTYSGTGNVTTGWFFHDSSGFNSYTNGQIGVSVTPQEDIHVADTVRADTAFNLNGADGVSGTLVLDDGVTERITLVFTGGILTSRTVETTVAALIDWTD